MTTDFVIIAQLVILWITTKYMGVYIVNKLKHARRDRRNTATKHRQEGDFSVSSYPVEQGKWNELSMTGGELDDM